MKSFIENTMAVASFIAIFVAVAAGIMVIPFSLSLLKYYYPVTAEQRWILSGEKAQEERTLKARLDATCKSQWLEKAYDYDDCYATGLKTIQWMLDRKAAELK
jgi:hypothetical protein